MTYRLENGEAKHQAHPDTFGIPGREERDNLQPGDEAKLIFLADDLHGERMWVEVEGRADDGGYVGRLDSDPIVIDANAGDIVRFRAEHVIEIMTSEDMAEVRETMLPFVSRIDG